MSRGKEGSAPRAAARWHRLPAPALIAVLTAFVGLVDIVAAISIRPTYWTWLGQLVPGIVTDAATGTSVGAGLLLVGLAHGLRRRKRRAWRAAVALSGAAVLLDVVRGFALVAAAVDLVPFAVLLATRRHFHAAGDPRTRWRALGACAAFTAADLVIGLALIRFRHGDASVADRLSHVVAGLVGITGPVRFPTVRDGDLVGAVLLALGAVTIGVTGYLVFRPARPVARLGAGDVTRLRALLARHGGRDALGYAALRPDNSVIWSPTGKAAVTYRVIGGVALAGGDPIGDPEAWPGAIGPFLALAAAHAWVPAAVGCSADGGRAWQRAGLRVLELGDQAVIRTGAFRLDGRPMRGVRQAARRADRAGYTTRIDRVADLTDDERTALAEQAAAWRSRGHTPAFGRICATEDGDCLVVRALRDGQVHGLLTFLPWGRDGLTLDVMRRDRAAANGLTEGMLVALLRAAPGLGITQVSLTFAPFRAVLARGEKLGAGPALRLWRRMLLGASRWFHLEARYRFTAKFDPDWHPRYVCWPTTRDLPRVLAAATRAEIRTPLHQPDRATTRQRSERHATCRRASPASSPLGISSGLADSAGADDLSATRRRARCALVADTLGRMATTTYQANRLRGPFNAVAFSVLDGLMDRLLGARKRRVYADLPAEVVELGSGVGANLRYLPPGTRLVAVEPNPAMHTRLRARAARHGVDLDLRGIVGERLDLADASADMVISSLVLCTVTDPEQVVAEVLRVLRPGGRYAFVEHVAAPQGTLLRRLQRALRRPWAWTFEGCSCERDLRSVIEKAGFDGTEIESYRLRSPLLPFNTHIAGIARTSRG